MRDKLHEAHLCESVEVPNFTVGSSPDDGLDVCPEDVLYELEMEDMCEQDPFHVGRPRHSEVARVLAVLK